MLTVILWLAALLVCSSRAKGDLLLFDKTLVHRSQRMAVTHGANAARAAAHGGLRASLLGRFISGDARFAPAVADHPPGSAA